MKYGEGPRSVLCPWAPNVLAMPLLAAAQKQTQAGQGEDVLGVREEDILSWEVSESKERLRESVYDEIDISHPITYGDCNICTLITQEKGKLKRIGDLKQMCEHSGLKAEGPEMRKDSFIRPLKSLVSIGFPS